MTSAHRGRILMLLENSPYPQDARVRPEASSLVGAGYRVTVIAPAERHQRATEMADGVRVYRYPRPSEKDGMLWYVFEYGYAMVATFLIALYVWARSGFDVVHAHSPPDTFVVIALFFKLFRKAFVFDHHDLSPEMYDARFGEDARPSVRRALLFFERATFRWADHVVSPNESYRTIAMERGGVPPEAVTVVRNGPDLRVVRPTSPDPQLREKAATIIGYAGVIAAPDGVDYLLRSLAHLLYDYERSDFYCVIAGDGSAVKDLMELSRNLALEQHVSFVGHLDRTRLMEVLSTADICVDPDPSNPYNDRSTMIKMAEYMALGKPVVAFDLPEHRVTAQEAALYATPNDEHEFAGKIVELMDDSALRQQMGMYGKSRATTDLAWSHQEGRLLATYETVLKEGPRDRWHSRD